MVVNPQVMIIALSEFVPLHDLMIVDRENWHWSDFFLSWSLQPGFPSSLKPAIEDHIYTCEQCSAKTQYILDHPPTQEELFEMLAYDIDRLVASALKGP